MHLCIPSKRRCQHTAVPSLSTKALVKIGSGGVGSLRPLRLDFRFDLSTLVLHELHELVVCKEHERDEQTQSDHAAGKASVDGFSLRSSSAPVGS
eukprot:COSAG06_NODE_7919_length_2334_cov_1.955257_2_plen_95_part_00